MSAILGVTSVEYVQYVCVGGRVHKDIGDHIGHWLPSPFSRALHRPTGRHALHHTQQSSPYREVYILSHLAELGGAHSMSSQMLSSCKSNSQIRIHSTT